MRLEPQTTIFVSARRAMMASIYYQASYCYDAYRESGIKRSMLWHSVDVNTINFYDGPVI